MTDTQNNKPIAEKSGPTQGANRRRTPIRKPAAPQTGTAASTSAQAPAKESVKRSNPPRRTPAAAAAPQAKSSAAKPVRRPAQANAPAAKGTAKVTPKQAATSPATPTAATRTVRPAAAKPATRTVRPAAAKPATRTVRPAAKQATPVRSANPAKPATTRAIRPVVKPSGTLTGRKNTPSKASDHPAKSTLRVIPLGGMCEIGKNMTALEYGQDIIIIDCGQSFPDETMPGVDAVIPDFTYVIQNKDRVRGIFLTHGHEDHIGGIPYLMKEIQAPIYGGRMTIELIKYKLEDRMPGLLKSCKVHSVLDGDVIRCGCFSVEFIHVNHSIADASMFAINTPVGYVVHSGDFKIDYTPVDGGIINLQRIAEIGREGVLLFMCESTNIEVKGFSSSEKHVGETFAGMFEHAQGRIFVATFSSNIYRLQQIFQAAEQHDRKVALVGRSMINVFNAANSLGYIRMRPDTLIDISKIDAYPPEKVVIISTGSQGEPMSALTRIAFSSHREIEIIPGDTVIISATPIPGNEKPIYKVINELYRRGAKVFYSALADVHVSGHASQEEIKLIHSLVRPRFLIPAHGEYRMLYQHAQLAESLGMDSENVFILENGDIFEISRGKARISGFTNGAAVLIDGTTSIDDANNTVLRERKLLSDDGVVTIAVALSKTTGELVSQPQVKAIGFLYASEYNTVVSACERRTVDFVRRMKAANKNVAESMRSGQMQGQIRSLLYEKTKRRPVVLVSVIEI